MDPTRQCLEEPATDLPSFWTSVRSTGTKCPGWKGTRVPTPLHLPVVLTSGVKPGGGSDSFKVTQSFRARARTRTQVSRIPAQRPCASLGCSLPNHVHPFSARIQSPITPRFFLRSGPVAPETCEDLGEGWFLGANPEATRGSQSCGGWYWSPGGGLAAAWVGHWTPWLLQEGWELDYRKDKLGRGGSGGGSGDRPSLERHLPGREQDDPIPGDLPHRKPRVGLGRGVQRKLQGGCPASWPCGCSPG